MKAIDTHCHLDFKDFEEDRDELIIKLAEQKIGLINVSSGETSLDPTIKLARQYENIWAAVGIHPSEASRIGAIKIPQVAEKVGQFIKSEPKIIAIGEVGLDYKETKSVNLQRALLIEMIRLAKENHLPAIFHCRNAYGDLTIMIENYGIKEGVIHCFMGSIDQANRFIDLGMYLSFTGNITYPQNSSLRQVIENIPFNRILIETDCPFLPPQNRRGQRNDPFGILDVAKQIAIIKNIDEDIVLSQTTANAIKLFKIKDELD